MEADAHQQKKKLKRKKRKEVSHTSRQQHSQSRYEQEGRCENVHGSGSDNHQSNEKLNTTIEDDSIVKHSKYKLTGMLVLVENVSHMR